jgi:excisionase family DNA binding protein
MDLAPGVATPEPGTTGAEQHMNHSRSRLRWRGSTARSAALTGVYATIRDRDRTHLGDGWQHPSHYKRNRIADMTSSPHQLMTFAETAEQLSVDVNTTRRNVRADQIPVMRPGRKVLIPAAWVDDPQGWPRHGR